MLGRLKCLCSTWSSPLMRPERGFLQLLSSVAKNVLDAWPWIFSVYCAAALLPHCMCCESFMRSANLGSAGKASFASFCRAAVPCGRCLPFDLAKRGFSPPADPFLQLFETSELVVKFLFMSVCLIWSLLRVHCKDGIESVLQL